MKALTVWQPWATLIIIGAKPFEFRKRDYAAKREARPGDRIVVHAGMHPIKREKMLDLLARIKEGTSALDPKLAMPLVLKILDAHKCQGVVPMGVGLGTAIIGVARRATELFGDSDRIDHHVWGWPLTNIVRWPIPVECRGMQGFWTWPYKIGS